MTAHTETYEGCEIVIDDQDQLQIGGKTIDLHKTDRGKWHSSYLPYTNYDELIALAREIVDVAPGFKAGT